MCRACGEEFEEGDDEYNPAQDLGDISLESVGEPEDDEFCPTCREQLGMTNVLFWFDS